MWSLGRWIRHGNLQPDMAIDDNKKYYTILRKALKSVI